MCGATLGGEGGDNTESMIDDRASCNIALPEGVTLALTTVTCDYQCGID